MCSLTFFVSVLASCWTNNRFLEDWWGINDNGTSTTNATIVAVLRKYFQSCMKKKRSLHFARFLWHWSSLGGWSIKLTPHTVSWTRGDQCLRTDVFSCRLIHGLKSEFSIENAKMWWQVACFLFYEDNNNKIIFCSIFSSEECWEWPFRLSIV